MEKNNTDREEVMFSIFQLHIAKDAKFVKKDSFEKVVDTLIFKRT